MYRCIELRNLLEGTSIYHHILVTSSVCISELSSISAGQSLNVALKSNGGSCTAAVPDMASNDDSDCNGAIDGFDSSSSNAFRFGFFGDPTRMWMKVTFREKYLIVLARFMQLFFAEETNFETIQMEFDSSPSQQVSNELK